MRKMQRKFLKGSEILSPRFPTRTKKVYKQADLQRLAANYVGDEITFALNLY